MFEKFRSHILVRITVAGLIIIGLLLGSNVAAQDGEDNIRDTPGEAAALAAPFQHSPLHYGSSQFEPPDEDSSTFVVDTAPGLDTGCTFAIEGDLVFDIEVDRFLGDVKRLTANGLIPEYAVLEMPAYDVDYYGGGSQYGPERDKVLFNGEPLSPEYLIGDNGIWVYNSFKIPYEFINFATPGNDTIGTASTPGVNTIRIKIDVLNDPQDTIWCTAIDWAALKVDVPYPLLLVHGLFGNGDSGSWQGPWRRNAIPLRAQSWITDLGFPAATITMGSGEIIGGTATIQDDALEIAERINNLSQAWGVDKFNIVSHSKGGLDSRHYAETHDTITTLGQIGTPNQGAPFVDALLAGTILLSHKTGFPLYDMIDLAAPGIDQLTVTHMSLYNLFHGYNPNTTYVSLAGEYTFGNFWDPILWGIHLGTNDTVVPTWSVHALDYAQHKLYTSYGTNTEARHTCIGDECQVAETNSATAYQILKSYFTDTQSGSTGTAHAPQSLETFENQPVPTDVKSTVTINDQIEQGQTHTHTLAIDSPASAGFALQYSKGDLNLVLISPSGVRIDPAVAGIDPNVEFDEFGMLGLKTEGYVTSVTEVGEWTLEVSAPTVIDPSGQEAYFVTAWLEGASITLEAQTDRSFYANGAPIIVQANVLDNSTPILGADVQAAVLFPDESTTVLSLLDNGSGDDAAAGDGIYTGRLSTTDQAGLYRIAVTAEGTSPRPFSRESVVLTTMSDSTSSLSGAYSDYGIDSDGNGLYNELVVDAELTITEAATYHVMAELATQSGETIASDIVDLALAPGLHTISLHFDGAQFFERRLDGPYRLSVIRLAEDDGLTVMPLDETLNAYTTTAYDHRAFEHPAIYMPGTGGDSGVDVNGNGLYDYLQVDLDLELLNSGSYHWSGQLVNTFGDAVGVADGYGYLYAGLETISFDFTGEVIGQSGIDGPYYLKNILVFSSYDSAVLTDTYVTSSYTADQFEGSSSQIPVAPALRFPENGASLVSTTPVFLWQSATYGNTYQIQIDNNANFSSPVQDVVVRELSYAASPLKENVRYYWRVRALNSAGVAGKWSQKWYMTIDSSPPSVPELRSPRDRTDISDTTPRLKWSKVAGANQYRIEVSSSLDFIDPEISSLTNRTNFTIPDTEALDYGRYYWRVQAGDTANNWSDWSAVYTFTVTILKSPKNGDFTTDTTPTLRWSKVKGAAQYHLQVSTSETFDTTVINDNTLTGTRYTPATDLPYGRYYWRMQVDMGSGYTDNWTPVWTFTVTPKPPGKPTLVTPANKAQIADAAPVFTWESVPDGDTYQIQIDDQSNFKSPVQDATVGELTYTAQPLTDPGRYYWRVRAINSVGVAGLWSSRWSFTLPGPDDAPVLVSPTDRATVCENDVPLTWDEIPGIADYQVQVSTTPKFDAPIVDAVVTGLTHTADDLADGWFYWRVRPVNDQGVGGVWARPWRFVVDTVGPIPPVLKAPRDLSGTLDTTPTFRWGRVKDADLYNIQVSDDPGFGTTPVDEELTQTRFVLPDADALAYGRYYWQVAAMDTCHWGEWSPPFIFTVTILKAPQDAATTTDTTPTFRWAKATGAAGYQFQLADNPDFIGPLVEETVTTTKYTPDSPLAHGLYYWRVSVDGGSTWMPAWTLTVTPRLPGKPKQITPANRTLTNDDTPMFGWEAVTDGFVYQIQIDDDKGFHTPDQDVTLGVGELAYLATELGEGTWYWRVRALNDVGAPGQWSARWALTVDITPPTIPVPIAPAEDARVTNPKLTLEWYKSDGADHYEVQLDINPAFPLPPIDVGRKTKYTPPTSLAQATYYWRVRAIDKAGNVSLWSDPRIFHLVAGNTIVTTPTPLPTPVPTQPAPPHKPVDGAATPEPPVITTPPPVRSPKPTESPQRPPRHK